jgi:tetraacyldisaccharide 4'-kinase
MTLDTLWYRRHPARWLLWPLSLVYGLLTAVRRHLYRLGWLRSMRLPVPVIVVGNITVGGTGKTPLVVWLVEQLRARGWNPGIVSRGYGGHARKQPQAVTAQSNPDEVGDEPVLMARRLHCPVVVAPSRVAAARCLLAEQAVDIIVADDGLQHYALARDLEIAVLDAARGLGNGLLLPAGPLREPPARLRAVDVVVSHGAAGAGWRMDLVPDALRRLDGSATQPLSTWAGRTVHAIAGIGHPERFFASLRAAGLVVRPHAFPDHHRFRLEDIVFNDNIDVVMTEKDAVKCAPFAQARHWYLPVQARVEVGAGPALDDLLRRLPPPGCKKD